MNNITSDIQCAVFCDWRIGFYAPMCAASLLWLCLLPLVAFFDSKLRLAVMASGKKAACCELSRGRKASQAASMFFSSHLLMAMADLKHGLMHTTTVFHVEILEKTKSQH